MKKKLIVTIGAVIVMAFLTMVLPTTSIAASCLDVRDYGYHRYNNRMYSYDYYGPEWTNDYFQVVSYTDSLTYLEQQIIMHYRRIYRNTDGECMCGLRTRVSSGVEVGLYSKEERTNLYMVVEYGIPHYEIR